MRVWVSTWGYVFRGNWLWEEVGYILYSREQRQPFSVQKCLVSFHWRSADYQVLTTIVEQRFAIALFGISYGLLSANIKLHWKPQKRCNLRALLVACRSYMAKQKLTSAFFPESRSGDGCSSQINDSKYCYKQTRISACNGEGLKQIGWSWPNGLYLISCIPQLEL